MAPTSWSRNRSRWSERMPRRSPHSRKPGTSSSARGTSFFSNFRPVRRSPGGGGAIGPLDQLMDILPHPVYVLLKFLRTSCRTPGSPAVDIRFLEADPSGEVIAILRLGSVIGRLGVTPKGRPVESYLRIIGTNGSLLLDFVRGSIVQLPGPGTSAIPILLNTYSEARQIAAGAVKGFFHLVAVRIEKDG